MNASANYNLLIYMNINTVHQKKQNHGYISSFCQGAFVPENIKTLKVRINSSMCVITDENTCPWVYYL